ncbi:glycosyltransferase [Thermodesulfobacteriota bacterium]
MKNTDKMSVITVIYNSKEFLFEFISSVASTNQEGLDVEFIMIDNGSSDGSVAWVRSGFPEITVLENANNNYAEALNIGINAASGDYIVIANNDAKAEANWLKGLVDTAKSNPQIGAVQSKIIFADSLRINSVGVMEIEELYFKDIGFDEIDTGQYEKSQEVNYITGGSVLFRRECLEDVGDWDEDFIMFMEDVDYSLRCRKNGWKLWYAHDSILYHHYHGTSSHELCEYLCTRNRFLFIAKHHPMKLPESIPSSHFYKNGQLDLLYRTLLHAIHKMCVCLETNTVIKVLEGLKKHLPDYLGEVSTYNFFSHLEVILGLRKIRVGIYDHAFHFAGGGQRYVAELASIIQDRYDVTYIANKDVDLANYRDWFDIDLSKCSLKIIKIPFFEERSRYIPDEGMVVNESYNVFDIISKDSLSYDIFINANMLGKVNPLSPVSLFVCHFPDQEKGAFFQVQKYDHLIINGDYTGSWIKKRWGLEPTHKLYPPVNMYNLQSTLEQKERIILSVSRFEQSGSKKQYELIKAFGGLCRKNPEKMKGWKLILVGGSVPDNHYLEQVKDAVRKSNCDIELKVNIKVEEVKDSYRRAAIFWHACGIDESRPERVEHFGMTTVEAMQNYCLPIVFDGGGQREIVEQEVSGFRFTKLKMLQDVTLRVIDDVSLRERLAVNAHEKSHLFNYEVFKSGVENIFTEMEADLLGQDVL